MPTCLLHTSVGVVIRQSKYATSEIYITQIHIVYYLQMFYSNNFFLVVEILVYEITFVKPTL